MTLTEVQFLKILKEQTEARLAWLEKALARAHAAEAREEAEG